MEKEYQEAAVARVEDLANGDMKQVKVGDTDVLLVRLPDHFYALGAKCTHYGAPLVKGVLHESRVICPWHHSCFDVRSGRHLEPPGCDGLPTFAVRTEGDDVVVRVPKPAPQEVVAEMAQQKSDQPVHVVLGGGAAGAYAAEAIREGGFTGRVVLVSKEEQLPYDRPKASKQYLQGAADDNAMPLRSPEFYRQHDIELMLGKEVTEVDVVQKEIKFTNGESLRYDGIVMCTGGKVQTLPVPGSDLKNVFTLRSWQDSKAIREAAQQAKRAVVIGASFIGLEGAAGLQKHGCAVTVVAPEEVPFGKVWGDAVGKWIQGLHEQKGVTFQLGAKVKALKGTSQVEGVVLESGETLPADLVLVGIGVKPNTDFIKGVDKADDGGLIASNYLKVTNGCYAAGDIVQFPFRDSHARIEHWRVACQQGRVAGHNLAGKKEAYTAVPFFWTAQQGTNIRYVGHVKDYDVTFHDGNVGDESFLVYYVKDGALKAVLGVNRDPDVDAIEELMRLNKVPSATELQGPIDWIDRLHRLSQEDNQRHFAHH
ncbi:Reductase C-terminal [Catalinimonas alkaloidigena]|uniref:Reductase C-terminal n=1 Tax=Catalinimonas alkaloidigena TaxID=1075417 RepID=A0A1G8XM81_9BACT|nr:FAD-dependent oxidoreductase [Catalinimonas alkaloidigena]SDJ91506.1 Reductase C-terminal [Catalinimonas alkaloidigena]